MKYSRCLVIAVFSAALAGCDSPQDSADSTSPVAPQDPMATTPPPVSEAPVESAPPAETPPVAAAEIEPPVETPLAIEPEVAPEPEPELAPEPEPAPAADSLSREDALALAQVSGCLACHNVEKKLIGPSWKDVALRYQGAADARATLIENVKTGSVGSWVEVTGGIPMPAYSPRVADEDIAALVDFILSL